MGKEKSITELKDERKNLRARSEEIIATARAEKRMFKAEESDELGANQARMAEIDLEIAAKEAENRSKRGVPHAPATREKFSLCRAILAEMNHTEQRDIEAAVIEEGRSMRSTSGNGSVSLVIPVESRAAFSAATEAATGVIVDEEQMEMLLPLQANLVLAQAGARFLTGLQGNIEWPSYSGSTVAWESETGAANDGAGTFSKGTVFSPKRLTAYVDISKQLLIQENTSVEAIIRQTLAQAIAQKVEATALGSHATDANMPDGLFTGFSEASAELNWASIVAMETNADVKNALFGNLAYILHPELIGKAKTKVKDASGAGGFVFGSDGAGFMNGYRAFRTTNLPTSIGTESDGHGAVFGNWADYFIGQWGAVELTIDPYTQAVNGMVRLVVNSYWNMGKIRKESFTVAALK